MMTRSIVLVTLLATLRLASATGLPAPTPAATPDAANNKVQARAPAPTPAPLPATGGSQANKGTRLVPGVQCNNRQFGNGQPAFQSYLSAHRGQQQMCPSDQRNRYLPDDQQIGCCTNSATLTQVGGQYGCCLCGSQCAGNVPPMGDWYYDQGQQLVITQAIPNGAIPGYNPVYSTAQSCLPGQQCYSQPGVYGGGPVITDPTNGGVYSLGFVPTSQTIVNGQSIFYGPNTVTTIFAGAAPSIYPGNTILPGQGGICNTYFQNGVAQTSCAPGAGGYGGYGGGTPCYTFFNGNQQSVSCAAGIGGQGTVYYSTSTQSICQTFNGQPSCSIAYITMATRTGLINAAARETGAVGMMGQVAAGLMVVGAGMIL